MRYIRPLTPEEKSSLEEGYTLGKKHHYRLKCKSILLSSEGASIGGIAKYSGRCPRSVRDWFDGFEREGISFFLMSPGRGIKAPLDSLTDAQVGVLKAAVEKDFRNLKACCAPLSAEFGFPVTKLMLARYVKKNSLSPGAGSAKA